MSFSYTKKDSTSVSDHGFCNLLTLLFIGLKITHHIDWSWWWVFAPFWIPAALICALFALALLVGLVAAIFE